MKELQILGGTKLQGEVRIQGAKNAVLPILAATILVGQETVIENCPRLRDVEASVEILQALGCRCGWEERNTLVVNAAAVNSHEIPEVLMRQMRSSAIFLGAILARCGEAVLSYPGGCEALWCEAENILVNFYGKL